MEGWFNLFGWLLSVLAAAGNAFVICLIVKNRSLHCSANWFVLSLAMADCGVGIVIFPISYLCNLQSKPCNMNVYVAFYWFLVHSSVTNLCCLTWDRYVAIVHPLKHVTSMTARHSERIILVSWLIPMIVSLIMILGMHSTNSETARKVFRLGGVSAFDLVCCSLLLYSVIRILIVARTQSKRDPAMENINRNLKSAEQRFQQNPLSTETAYTPRPKRNMTASFIIVILLFFLGCHVVINCLIILIILARDVSDKAGWVVTLLLAINSAANPLVYAFLKHDIKKETTRLICRGATHNCSGERPRISMEMAEV